MNVSPNRQGALRTRRCAGREAAAHIGVPSAVGRAARAWIDVGVKGAGWAPFWEALADARVLSRAIGARGVATQDGRAIALEEP